MATGTSAGLLDSGDHAQSVFKHAIIRQYMRPFLAMTGSTSKQGRVVVEGEVAAVEGTNDRLRSPQATAFRSLT